MIRVQCLWVKIVNSRVVNNKFIFINLSASNLKDSSFLVPSSYFKTRTLKQLGLGFPSILFQTFPLKHLEEERGMQCDSDKMKFKILLFRPRTTRFRRRKKCARCCDGKDTVKAGLVLFNETGMVIPKMSKKNMVALINFLDSEASFDS